MTEDLKVEQQYIYLLINHKDLVEDFVESALDIVHFHEEHKMIVHAIEEAHEESVLLTRKSFVDFLSDHAVGRKESAKYERIYNAISFKSVDKNDYPMLKSKILESYLVRTSGKFIKEYAKECKEGKSVVNAITKLSNNVSDLVSGVGESNKIIYEDILNFSDDFLKHIVDVREGKIEEEEIISSGFSEIDYSTQIGLAPGTLTLFCGDVGGFKSSMMLNVALNVWLKSKKNVLFVPLEMPKEQIWNKMISRETRIPFENIAHPKSLTDEQLKKIARVTKSTWISHKENNNARFFIMDSYEDRVKVSTIRRQIERNIQIFKPDLVVVDYVGNLETDKNRDGRHDLEIGDMLKSMRHMGRKGVCHESGFSIVSGAQLGRESLKRVRRQSSDKIIFNSEDIRGSHEYSADADNIFVLFVDPQQPNDKLQIFPVKSRYGRNIFQDGQRKACLDLRPEMCLISSSEDFYSGDNASEVLQKISEEDDLDLDENDSTASEVQKVIDADELEW